jgi:hypothetical protein
MRRSLGFTVFLGAITGLQFAVPPRAAASPRETPLGSETPTSPSAGSGCTAPAWSSSSVYVGGDTVTYGGNEYTAAYWNQNAEPDTNTGPQYSGQPWGPPVACQSSTCVPACSGLQCGSDGCGGSCGTCSAGLTCNPNNQCVASCVPACSGLQCGSDGCGGSCGTCASGQTCDSSGECETNAPQTTSSLLDVPLDPQLQSEWCWAASAEMVMAYLGTNVEQCAQANYLFGRTDCCTNADSAEDLSECNQPGWPNWSYWGFSFEETAIGTALSFAQLQTEIAANRPVGFAWSWSTGGGHYMVATGTEVGDDGTQYVTINDPWAPNIGDQVTLTYTDWVAGPAGTDSTATVSYTHMADDYGITQN